MCFISYTYYETFRDRIASRKKNREESEHCKATLKNYYIYCYRIRRSAILSKRTVRDLQKHIISQSNLPVMQIISTFQLSISFAIVSSTYEIS